MSMNDKLFVIAIGGTGMRCLESFVHLCAIGMFDNQEINILTLDTDQANGNKSRVETLIDLYQKVKSNDSSNVDGGLPNTDTFFSAKLNLYRFFTDYTNPSSDNYQKLASVPSAPREQQQENQDLADLFFPHDTVQQFNLAHGYRAQTHLGSMLMYHGIVQAVRNYVTNKEKSKPEEKALADFITLLTQASPDARVFIFGSVFGGTGASSIPIIPRALSEASTLLGGNVLDPTRVKFGSTLLTEYFTFKSPDEERLRREKGIIASSDYFPINSQAALQFYQDDPTVKHCYKRLYLVGWPLVDKPVDNDSQGEPPTGGAEQKNPCHVVELMCACAAYDFFTLEGVDDIKEVEYCYRNVNSEENRLNFTGSDFCDNGDLFTNKLGAFFSLAHIILASNEAAFGKQGTKNLLRRFKEQSIDNYDSITDDQAAQIDSYMRSFGYMLEPGSGRLTPGWICQINHSVGSGQFIFQASAFPKSAKDIPSIDPGDIFIDNRHNWIKGGFMNGKSRDKSFNLLIGILAKPESQPKDKQNVKTAKEKFLAHLYNGITIAQKFNTNE